MRERDCDQGFAVVFESLGSANGLDVVDPIERRRRSFHTPTPVSPTPTDTDRFPFPVETAVEVVTSSLSMPTAEQVIVRDADGGMVTEVEHGETRTFPAGDYVLEPTGIVRTYVRAQTELSIDGKQSIGDDGQTTTVDFGAPTQVAVGSLSQHERPAATVTTTADPADVLAAISTFGSALKTTSPERAFGSFRGHPPAIEVGSELSIPDGLEPPADDVHLEVPAAYSYAFPIAPLAYYLGCPVREGPEPRLVADGWEHDLERTGSVDDGVRRALQRIFFLECVTRTEGLYQIDLHERGMLEERIDLPFADLYDAPQSERLQAFLDVPHELVADLLPDWRNAAHVENDVESVAALPHLVDDLALIDVADVERVSPSVVESGGVQGLLRGETDADDVRRGSAAASTTFVKPQASVDANEETWVGDGTPIGATKAVTQAYRNRIGRSPTTGDIDIAVVANADEMTEEGDLVDEVYGGSRTNLPFDVTVHRHLSTDALADVLAAEHDCVHYVGHIHEDGFECADGLLDVATLDSVGMDAFFLNACQSYSQGMALIEAGAIGGIVTIRDVVNHGAVRIGQSVARLLNYGFPLRAALEIARGESIVGSLYTVVGDGGLSVVQCAGGTPLLVDLERRGDEYAVQLEMYGAETGMGGLCVPHSESTDGYYLASSTTETLHVDADELAAFLDLDDCPVLLDGQLTWPDEIDPLSL